MVTVVLLLLAGVPGEGGSDLVVRTQPAMHTLVSVGLPAALPEAQREAAWGEVFAVFERIDAELNEWAPGSALSRVNAGAGGPGVEAPADLCAVVLLALDGARRTGGTFDPTWAAVRTLWRFGTAETGVVPSPRAVAQACRHVGWRKVGVLRVARPTAERACRIALRDRQAQLGLGGVVKGWGVDQAVALLRARGLSTFTVQAGGDLFVSGQPGGRPWGVGLREPRGAPDEAFARVEVQDQACSTSADSEHFFLKDGVRYHHLLDPRTCLPARGAVSVTVLAKTALDAEVLTKAAFVLGPKDGRAVVEAFGADAVWVTPDGGVQFTEGAKGRLDWRPPVGFE